MIQGWAMSDMRCVAFDIIYEEEMRMKLFDLHADLGYAVWQTKHEAGCTDILSSFYTDALRKKEGSRPSAWPAGSDGTSGLGTDDAPWSNC